MMDTLSDFSTPLTPVSPEASARGDLLVTVEMAIQGDHTAFADLVAAMHQSVFRWALTFSRDLDDAEEITQATFAIVHRKLRQYRGKSSFEAWLFLITRNVAFERHRSVKRRKRLADAQLPGIDAVYNTDPGARVDRERVAAYIRHFFLSLPPRQREVFDLVDLQGNDPAQVAELLGTKPGVVRANLFKARASIRAHLLETHPSWREIDR